MTDNEFSQMPYRNVVLIGVGTVFGTLGVFLAAMLGGTFIWSHKPILNLPDALNVIMLNAVVGGLIALAMCMALVVPMVALWNLTFNRFRRRGYTLPRAAMTTAGLLALFANLAGVMVFAMCVSSWKPFLMITFVTVPTAIAVVLARYFSYDRRGAVWE